MLSCLIVKTSALGDIIQTLPVAQYLKEEKGVSSITWVAEESFVPLLEACPYIDKVIPIATQRWKRSLLKKGGGELFQFIRALRKEKFDLLFDLQGNIKSSFITLSARAFRKIGFAWKDLSEWPNGLATKEKIPVFREKQGYASSRYLRLVQGFFKDSEPFIFRPFSLALSEEEKKEVSQLLSHSALQTGPILMVACNSRWQTREMSQTQLVSFLEEVQKKYGFSFLLIYGNEREKERAHLLHHRFPCSSIIAGKMSIPAWQALMQGCQAAVVVDSSSLHLGIFCALPTFAVFGPSSIQIYNSPHPRHGGIQGPCPYGTPWTTRWANHCPKMRNCPTGACVKEMALDTILKSFDSWWKQLPSSTD